MTRERPGNPRRSININLLPPHTYSALDLDPLIAVITQVLCPRIFLPLPVSGPRSVLSRQLDTGSGVLNKQSQVMWEFFYVFDIDVNIAVSDEPTKWINQVSYAL
jgi:hypothetical protein